MIFHIDKAELISALQKISYAVMTYKEAARRNDFYGIYRNFICEINDLCLTIDGCCGQVVARTTLTIDEKPEKPVLFSVKATPFLKVLRTLENQSLEIEVLEYQIIVRHNKGDFAFPTTDCAEYKRNAHVGDESKQRLLRMEAPGLLSILDKCNYAMAEDELRPAMNGVCMNLTKEFTDFAASNGHKLVRIRKQPMMIDEPKTLIFPSRAVSVLKKILPDTGMVDIVYNTDNTFCHVVVDGFYVGFRFVDGKYPNYNSVIPDTFKFEFEANRLDLIKSFERLIQFTPDCGLTVFVLKSGELKLKAKDEDFEVMANEIVPCTYNGEKFVYGFETKSLIQTLKSIKSTNVVFKTVSESQATVIAPAIQPHNEDVTMLLMPMIIRDSDKY